MSNDGRKLFVLLALLYFRLRVRLIGF